MNRVVNHEMEWPPEGNTISWSSKDVSRNITSDKIIVNKPKLYDNNKPKIYTNSNINNKTNVSRVKASEPVRVSNKRIRVKENIQLVPPSYPPSCEAEWRRERIALSF